MRKGIDANQNMTDYAGALVNAGYTFICRYLPHSTKADPLSRAEAQHESDMGLDLVAIYESHSPTQDSYFTPEQGVTDGNAALAACLEVGMPAGRPAYFTVDEDAEPCAVLDYFRAIRTTAFRANYLLGVYGSVDVCRMLLDAGLVHFGWVAQSGGWSHDLGLQTRDIQQGPEFNLRLPGINQAFDVDANTTDADDFGGWRLPPS